MDTCKYLLLWIWQIIQNILGLSVLIFNKVFLRKRFILKERIVVNGSKTNKTWYKYKSRKPKKISGLSLGDYFFIWVDIDYPDKVKLEKKINEVKEHELMHSFQSEILGPLYLIIIGIPSIIMTGVSSAKFMEGFYTENILKKYTQKQIVYYRCQFD